MEKLSCIKIETASLVFASLSLLLTSLGSLVCIALMVHVNVLMTVNLNRAVERKLPIELDALIAINGLYLNVHLAVVLATMVVSLAFSIILTKGLLSKKAHLVKAFFVYAVTKKIFIVLSLIYLFTNVTFNIQLGFLSLFGCFLYSLVLVMIWKTHLKLSHTDYDQFCHKKLEEEKSTA